LQPDIITSYFGLLSFCKVIAARIFTFEALNPFQIFGVTMPKISIPEKWLRHATNNLTSRFEVSSTNEQDYGTERSLLRERLLKEAQRPSSSAWQSEGFVILLVCIRWGEDLRPWVQIPSRALFLSKRLNLLSLCQAELPGVVVNSC
jgi:hypothetical protein